MYTLLTGATGLVGRYLVRDLLLNGHELAVVVRPSRRQSPRERIEEILQHWETELGRPLPRPVVLSGDIAEPGFGLSDEDREWVKAHVTSIIHSAAILEFYGKDRAGEPWRSNLNGTQNMIQLCRDLEIRDIHHVSTAYVAGLQTGRAMEDNLDVGQTFRNDYEESKFLAEKLVRQIDFADHVTIYRPAVISGDSLTGYTNTYHGIYLYLRLLALMIPAIPPGPDGKRHTPVRLRMTGDERRNIIPVEWVSAVMCRIFETPEARGKTFHIAPDNPISARQMIEYCGEYFNSTGATFCGHDAPMEEVDRTVNEDQWMFERLIRENAETYAPYERTDNTFDMTNTKTFAGDIVCPDIDKTVIFRYIDYGNEDKWGKRKPAAARVNFWAEDQLSAAASRAGDGSTVVGIDVLGAGGVQLTLHMNGQSLVSVERGLPEGDVPVLTISSNDLAAVSRGERPAEVLHAAWQNCTADQARELSDAIAAGITSEVVGTRS
ncbi:MAG: SDR family oxidoreductase [Planctomycetaceae bacterium]|nr:SDR family oxidoreductase [Planctomycetaceae bacterium]